MHTHTNAHIKKETNIHTHSPPSHSHPHINANKQTEIWCGEQLYTGLRNSYFIRRPLCCLCVPHMYSVCVWVAIRSSIPPTFCTLLCTKRKTLQTKLFSGKRFVLFAHSLSPSRSLSLLSRPFPHTRYCPIRLFIPFVYSLVGWFWSDSRKTHTISTVRFMLYVYTYCIHIYGCYGRLSLLFHYVFVVHVQRILGKSTHKKEMPK